jgi:murein L,D-transpeptidase YcbB/YkuD
MRHLTLFVCATALTFSTACKDARSDSSKPWAPAPRKSVAGVPEAEVDTALKQRLAGARPSRIDEHKWRHVLVLYKAYGNNPLWLSADGLDERRAFALTNALVNAEHDALRLDGYPIGELATAISRFKADTKPTADQIAEADILLTSSFVSLGVDYLIGQVDPKKVSQNWHIDRHDENEDSALVRSIRNPELDKSIASMRPTDEDYVSLENELTRFRAMVAKGGWPTVPEGKAVKPGETDNPARLAALRARLAAEGIAGSADTAGPGRRSPGTYDRSLAGAVATFQARHTIAIDSMLGPETVKSLNIPATYRLGQIAANLERFRWLPRNLGSRYVYVNVPAFRLQAYNGGEKVLEMKVIVGEEFEGKATPVFADSMEFVVFRPFWNVPPGIAEKEIFPKMSSGYLASHDMETYREGGALRIRQRPGPKNSLGLVKFLFPNDFNIYLHDTPQGELFEKDVRAFSHGCIRLEHPEQMAEFALGWPLDKVEEAMNSGPDNKQIRLPQKIPVFIVYATAYIRNGQLYFGNDLYDRDGPVVEAVAEGAMPSTQSVQAVQALRRIAAG